MTTITGRLHQQHVFDRRVRILAGHLAPLIPEGASVLDVGCGDGSVSHHIRLGRPDVTVAGIDVLVRPEPLLPVTAFDGETIPFPDNSFDVVLFVDVLHHTEQPPQLLREARRVAREAIVLKDHTRTGILAGPTLRFMDWVGNAHHGVVLPYNYWTLPQWRQAFDALGLEIRSWQTALGLYPWPASLLFDRSLHFIASLAVPGSQRAAA